MSDPTAVQQVATALISAVDTNQMLSNFATFVPVIGAVLIFGFTYYVIRRIITGARTGKVKC